MMCLHSALSTRDNIICMLCKLLTIMFYCREPEQYLPCSLPDYGKSNLNIILMRQFVMMWVCIAMIYAPFNVLLPNADDRSKIVWKMWKLWNFKTIFGITMKNAFKQVQTCLLLVHWFVKYTLKFQKCFAQYNQGPHNIALYRWLAGSSRYAWASARWVETKDIKQKHHQKHYFKVTFHMRHWKS